MQNLLATSKSMTLNDLDPTNPLNFQFSNLSINHELLIGMEQITISDEHLGDGFYGVVRKGKLLANFQGYQNFQIEVAIKSPRSTIHLIIIGLKLIFYYLRCGQL